MGDLNFLRKRGLFPDEFDSEIGWNEKSEDYTNFLFNDTLQKEQRWAHVMRYVPRLSSWFLLFCLASSVLLADQRMPQDGWIYEGKRVLSSGFRGMTIGRDGLIYAGVNGKIAVFDRELNQLRSFGTFSTIYGLACDSQTNIYVLEQSSVKVFDPSGVLLRQWGSAGSQDEQFSILGSSPNGQTMQALAIDSLDTVYIADGTNFSIKIFDREGNYLRRWGDGGTQLVGLDGGLHKLTTVAVLPGDRIATWFFVGPNPMIYQIFDRDGKFLLRIGGGNKFGVNMHNMTPTPDGLLMIPSSNELTLRDQFYNLLTTFKFHPSRAGQNWLQVPIPCDRTTVNGITFDPFGRMYCALSFNDGCFVYDGIYAFERIYNDESRPLVASGIPQPLVEKVSQRPGTTLIDIDYTVLDQDSEAIQVGIIAFEDGNNSLSSVVKMTEFVEDTSSNLGAGISPNQTRRITWDVEVDWNVGFGNIQFEILAKDARELLPFRFITVPPSAQNPAIQISDKPINGGHLLSIWYWLIAIGDPAIRFTNGEVFGVGGNFDTKKLASGGTTTADGITFLHERLGVRPVTQDEIARANSARYGFPTTVGSQHLAKLP